MNSTTETTPKKKTKKETATIEHDSPIDVVENVAEEVSLTLQERLEQARDVVQDVKEKAEITMKEHPYMVPLAAGAVGVGIGVLLSSKITRYLVLTAAGTVLTDAFGPQIREYGKQIVGSFKQQLEDMADTSEAAAEE